MACEVCGWKNLTQHTFREMMFGTREAFLYLECQRCGQIQIAQPPQDLARYYPSSYYSFSRPPSSGKRLRHRLHLLAARLLPSLRENGGGAFRSVLHTMPPPRARVLDVGSGSGQLVTLLRAAGLDALGIDPYLVQETPFISRVHLAGIERGWDLIMFHHSLEHMPNQAEVLRSARGKLNPGGVVLVRIPILNWAWQHYGANWVQLDAPRHLALHTLDSFRRTCDHAGLRIVETVFDSGTLQFTGSELYQRDIPLMKAKLHPFAYAEKKAFRRKAKGLNRAHLGDQAAFYLAACP